LLKDRLRLRDGKRGLNRKFRHESGSWGEGVSVLSSLGFCRFTGVISLHSFFLEETEDVVQDKVAIGLLG
jgi:hypothetical protein